MADAALQTSASACVSLAALPGAPASSVLGWLGRLRSSGGASRKAGELGPASVACAAAAWRSDRRGCGGIEGPAPRRRSNITLVAPPSEPKAAASSAASAAASSAREYSSASCGASAKPSAGDSVTLALPLPLALRSGVTTRSAARAWGGRDA